MARARQIHAAVKRHYFERGGTKVGWRKITNNPQQFNRVWRAMLRLPRGTNPPTTEYRS